MLQHQLCVCQPVSQCAQSFHKSAEDSQLDQVSLCSAALQGSWVLACNVLTSASPTHLMCCSKVLLVVLIDRGFPRKIQSPSCQQVVDHQQEINHNTAAQLLPRAVLECMNPHVEALNQHWCHLLQRCIRTSLYHWHAQGKPFWRCKTGLAFAWVAAAQPCNTDRKWTYHKQSSLVVQLENGAPMRAGHSCCLPHRPAALVTQRIHLHSPSISHQPSLTSRAMSGFRDDGVCARQAETGYNAVPGTTVRGQG